MTLPELLRYYERKTASSVSVEVRHPAFYHCDRLKFAPDQYLHHSDFCRAAKLRDANAGCSANKLRSLEVAKRGRCFSGCCPCGIWEYACPVMHNGELAAVLYFGGLNPGEQDGEDLPPPLRTLPCATEDRKKKIRTAAAFVAEFLKIELELFLSSGGMDAKQHGEAFYLENCRNFINCHYLENIAHGDLADMLKVNPNYLGALIRRKTGSTFRALLAHRRIEESKIYLTLHKYLTVTQVARLCGFTDSNYFSSVFRKLCGKTPLEYKREYKKEKEAPASPSPRGTCAPVRAAFPEATAPRHRTSDADSASCSRSGSSSR